MATPIYIPPKRRRPSLLERALPWLFILSIIGGMTVSILLFAIYQMNSTN